MAEKLVTVFELDVSGYLEQLRVLNIQIQQAKENQKELAKAAADGNKEAGIQLQEVNAFLKIQQKEYASLQRSLVGFTTANQKNIDTLDFSNNSIKQNRALLSQLTGQYNSMDKVGREKVAPTIKKISDELKRQEGAIGDTRRNVGNYTQSILEAVKGIQGLGGAVNVIGNLGSAFQTAGGGVKGFTAALAATGLPLVITGVNLLIDAFKNFKPVADAVENTITGIAAGFKAFISGGDIQESIRLSIALLETLRDLEDTQAAFNIQQEKYINDINRLIVASKDRTKSESDRLNLIKEANRIEREAFEESKKRIDQEIRDRAKDFIQKNKITIDEYNLLTRSTSQEALELRKRLENSKAYSEEDLKTLQERILERTRLEGQSLTLQEKLANRSNALEESLQQEREKNAKQREENLKKEADRLKRESDQDLKARQQLRENIILERELLSFGLQTQAQLDAEFEEALLKDSLLTYKEFYEEKKKLYNADLKAKEELQKEQAALDKEAVDMAKKTAEEIERANQQALQAGQDAIFQFTNEIIQIGQGITSTVGEILNTVSTLAIQNLEYQYQQGEISARKFNAMVAEEKRKAWKQSKALSITQTIFNTASAVMAQLSNPTPYVGIVLAALAAATGAAQIALIAKQKPPQFAKGGAIQIGGKSHAEGGTPIHVGGKLVAEAEKGENMYILKKEASAQINALSAFNQMFGGRSFSSTPTKFAADGGMINTGDGGFFTRSVKSNNEISAMRKAFIDGAQSLPAPVVSVKEIDRVNANKNRAIAVSEL